MTAATPSPGATVYPVETPSPNGQDAPPGIPGPADVPTYVSPYAPAMASGKGEAIHETTNGRVTLCRRQVDPERQVPVGGLRCWMCAGLKVGGKVSPAEPGKPRGGARRRPASEATPGDPLVAKASELVQLGKEIGDLRLCLERKLERFTELSGELASFTQTVSGKA